MKDTLCNNHNENIYDINCIIKYIKAIDMPNIHKETLCNILQDIKNRTKHCKKLGQKLENRCKAYRNAIESLGFTRNV